MFRTNNDGLSLARLYTICRLPKNIERRNHWSKILGIELSTNLRNTDVRLCNVHFSPDDIIEHPVTGKRKLKPGAVPIR